MHKDDIIFSPRFELPIPALIDYFGLWMIHDASFSQLVQQIQGFNLLAHVQSSAVQQRIADRDSRSFSMTNDGIAQFLVAGPMMKSVPSGEQGVSTIRLRQQIRDAKRDPQVKGAMLVMDTPGGTAKGNTDLADEVAAFAKVKPIVAFVEDMTASAGVSVASQATKRFANNSTAIYGAMGTYSVIYDQSGRADQLGIKVHVIRAGEFKGMAEAGTPVTQEQLQEVQRVVNRLNDNYLGLIARGLNRSVDSLLPLADGRAIMASDAVTHGLLDGIQTFEQTYQQLLEMVSGSKSPQPSQRITDMAATPATLAELKATFPNSTAEWRETQMEAAADMQSAAVSYAKFIETRAAEEREQHKKQLEEATKNARTQPSLSLGHPALTIENVGGDDSRNVGGDPVADFDAAVRARLPKTHAPSFEDRQKAVGHVARANPQLHRGYLMATNSRSPRMTRILQEKFGDLAE